MVSEAMVEAIPDVAQRRRGPGECGLIPAAEEGSAKVGAPILSSPSEERERTGA